MTNVFFPSISESKFSRVNSKLEIGSAAHAQNANDSTKIHAFNENAIVSRWIDDWILTNLIEIKNDIFSLGMQFENGNQSVNWCFLCFKTGTSEIFYFCYGQRFTQYWMMTCWACDMRVRLYVCIYGISCLRSIDLKHTHKADSSAAFCYKIQKRQTTLGTFHVLPSQWNSQAH